MQLPDAAPFTIWPSRLAAYAPGDESAPHAHHAMHLMLARHGELSVRVGDDEHHAPGVLTAPDVRHAVNAVGRVVLLAFWEPESVDGASLRATFEGDLRLISETERLVLLDDLPDAPGREDLDRFMTRARDTLAAPTLRPRMHQRVRTLLKILRDVDGPERDHQQR